MVHDAFRRSASSDNISLWSARPRKLARTIQTPEAMKMLANEKLAGRKVPLQAPVLSDKALIISIALAFLFLHILAGVILQSAPTTKATTPQQETMPSLHD
jgi:hypothetical protein